jgi:hypothetical protein
MTSPLLDLPPEISHLIYTHLPMKEMGFFASTGKKAESESIRARLLKTAAFALPESYKQDDKTKLAAIALLRKYPDLLFKKDYVKDPAGHWIFGSAYQVFLGANDIWALKTIYQEILPNIKDGLVTAQEQFNEQFPNHAATGSLYDARNIALIAQIKENLAEIVAAFREDPCTDSKATQSRTIHAIKRLRAHLAPKEDEVIRTGLHSPPEIIRMIYAICYRNMTLWSSEKLGLYTREVIGSAERVATAIEAQCYKKGLLRFNEENYRPDRTTSYFTLSGAPDGLGDDFFIEAYQGGLSRQNANAAFASFCLKIYIKAKESPHSKLIHNEPDQVVDQIMWMSLNMKV